MAQPNLFEAIGRNAYNSLSEVLTGKPTPGSDKDLRQRIARQGLERQLESLKKNPSDPAEFQRALDQAQALQGLQLGGQRALNEESLRYGGGLNALRMQRDRADTDNQIRTLDAKGSQQKDILNQIFSHEQYLAGQTEADAMQQVLNFYERAHDKNLAANAQARQANIPALLAGLAATAASLFA